MLIHTGCGGQWKSHRDRYNIGEHTRTLLCIRCGVEVWLDEHLEVTISDGAFIHNGLYCQGYRRGILMLDMGKGMLICTNKKCPHIPLTEIPGVEIKWQPPLEQLPLPLVLS